MSPRFILLGVLCLIAVASATSLKCPPTTRALRRLHALRALDHRCTVIDGAEFRVWPMRHRSSSATGCTYKFAQVSQTRRLTGVLQWEEGDGWTGVSCGRAHDVNALPVEVAPAANVDPSAAEPVSVLHVSRALVTASAEPAYTVSGTVSTMASPDTPMIRVLSQREGHNAAAISFRVARYGRVTVDAWAKGTDASVWVTTDGKHILAHNDDSPHARDAQVAFQGTPDVVYTVIISTVRAHDVVHFQVQGMGIRSPPANHMPREVAPNQTSQVVYTDILAVGEGLIVADCTSDPTKVIVNGDSSSDGVDVSGAVTIDENLTTAVHTAESIGTPGCIDAEYTVVDNEVDVPLTIIGNFAAPASATVIPYTPATEKRFVGITPVALYPNGELCTIDDPFPCISDGSETEDIGPPASTSVPLAGEGDEEPEEESSTSDGESNTTIEKKRGWWNKPEAPQVEVLGSGNIISMLGDTSFTIVDRDGNVVATGQAKESYSGSFKRFGGNNKLHFVPTMAVTTEHFVIVYEAWNWGSDVVHFAVFSNDGTLVADVEAWSTKRSSEEPVQMAVHFIPPRVQRDGVWRFIVAHHGAFPYAFQEGGGIMRRDAGERSPGGSGGSDKQDTVNVVVCEVRNVASEGAPAFNLISGYQSFFHPRADYSFALSTQYMGQHMGRHLLVVSIPPAEVASLIRFGDYEHDAPSSYNLLLFSYNVYGTVELVDLHDVTESNDHSHDEDPWWFKRSAGPSQPEPTYECTPTKFGWTNNLARVGLFTLAVRFPCAENFQTFYRLISVTPFGFGYRTNRALSGAYEGAENLLTTGSKSQRAVFFYSEGYVYSWMVGQLPHTPSFAFVGHVAANMDEAVFNELGDLQADKVLDAAAVILGPGRKRFNYGKVPGAPEARFHDLIGEEIVIPALPNTQPATSSMPDSDVFHAINAAFDNGEVVGVDGVGISCGTVFVLSTPYAADLHITPHPDATDCTTDAYLNTAPVAVIGLEVGPGQLLVDGWIHISSLLNNLKRSNNNPRGVQVFTPFSLPQWFDTFGDLVDNKADAAFGFHCRVDGYCRFLPSYVTPQ